MMKALQHLMSAKKASSNCFYHPIETRTMKASSTAPVVASFPAGHFALDCLTVPVPLGCSVEVVSPLRIPIHSPFKRIQQASKRASQKTSNSSSFVVGVMSASTCTLRSRVHCVLLCSFVSYAYLDSPSCWECQAQ